MEIVLFGPFIFVVNY